jgi:TatA/E family protein of Tat protein translocase
MFGGLGFTELVFVFIIALIVFGPRKLPELGKSLGQALGQFKRASEDFKRSWEEEVELEQRRPVEARPATGAIAQGTTEPEPTIHSAADPLPTIEEVPAHEVPAHRDEKAVDPVA